MPRKIKIQIGDIVKVQRGREELAITFTVTHIDREGWIWGDDMPDEGDIKWFVAAGIKHRNFWNPSVVSYIEVIDPVKSKINELISQWV
jgi:hypothetical protein